jgi:tetrahydromethanopterin S-methyltransferase subunit E
MGWPGEPESIPDISLGCQAYGLGWAGTQATSGGCCAVLVNALAAQTTAGIIGSKVLGAACLGIGTPSFLGQVSSNADICSPLYPTALLSHLGQWVPWSARST